MTGTIEWDTSSCSGGECTTTTCLTCTNVKVLDASTPGIINFYIRIEFTNSDIYVFS